MTWRSSASWSTKKVRNARSRRRRSSTLGFPYSISETFLRKNQNQSPEEALEELEKIQKKADEAWLDVVVYISMAFGNPYGDLWNVDEVIEAISLIEVDSLQMISLADTVGMATPRTDRRNGGRGDGEVRLS